MRIQMKIMWLVAGLLFLVVGSVALNLFWFTQRQVQANSDARIEVMMRGVERLAKESLRAGDDIMLLSYLKSLIADRPEVVLALVRRQKHTSVVGELNDKVFYRNITVTGATLVAGKANKLLIQIGFSTPELDKRIKQERLVMLRRIVQSSVASLLIGLIGAWWAGRRIAAPIVAIAAKMRVFGGKSSDKAAGITPAGNAAGDEVRFLEEQYKIMAEKIQESVQFKEDLLLTLTHELNNPLAGLKGILWGLKNPKACENSAAVQEDCRVMSDAVNLMELSLSNTIQLFKLNASPKLKLEKVVVNEVMHRVIRLLMPAAHAKNLKIEENIPTEPIHLNCDPELLRRVIINLVSNAYKYTPSGGVVLVTLQEQSGNVNLCVSDTGPGIAPSDKEAIFTKFYRVPGPDGKHPRIPGSGLGLAITKQAVELHNGRIWVESELGKGSSFHVTLPQKVQNIKV